MILKNKFCFLILVLLGLGCQTFNLSWFGKKYEDPAHRFQIQIPRTWKIQEGNVLGAPVVFYASENDPLFRANLNVVVQGRDSKRSLTEIVTLSEKQLVFLLDQYEVLLRSPISLGSFPAFEIRGRYKASEGWRFLRSIIVLSDVAEYVLTFSCRLDEAPHFYTRVNQILKTFHIPKDDF